MLSCAAKAAGTSANNTSFLIMFARICAIGRVAGAPQARYDSRQFRTQLSSIHQKSVDAA